MMEVAVAMHRTTSTARSGRTRRMPHRPIPMPGSIARAGASRLGYATWGMSSWRTGKREFSKIERCSITEAGDLRIAPSSLHMAFSLGSRLNHSQKSMVAARLVADRKFLVSLSYRVAMRRKGRSGAGVRLMGFMADQFGDGWSFWTLNVLEDFCRSPRSFRA
mgnify:CR=1 FL=1